MNIYEAIRERHSVRQYIAKPLDDDVIDKLVEVIAKANYFGELNIQLRVEEPDTFQGRLATYGQFRGVRNYIALVGKKGDDLEERCGYFGEEVVLQAQMLGLNTCWIGLTYDHSKMRAVIGSDEVCPCIIALGYGETQGKPHRVKELEKLCTVNGAKVDKLYDLPRWFTSGLEAAQLAPTAINQQRFSFDLVQSGEAAPPSSPHSCKVHPSTKFGPYVKVDLGIAKRHFEIGANKYFTGWKFV